MKTPLTAFSFVFLVLCALIAIPFSSPLVTKGLPIIELGYVKEMAHDLDVGHFSTIGRGETVIWLVAAFNNDTTPLNETTDPWLHCYWACHLEEVKRIMEINGSMIPYFSYANRLGDEYILYTSSKNGLLKRIAERISSISKHSSYDGNVTVKYPSGEENVEALSTEIFYTPDIDYDRYYLYFGSFTVYDTELLLDNSPVPARNARLIPAQRLLLEEENKLLSLLTKTKVPIYLYNVRLPTLYLALLKAIRSNTSERGNVTEITVEGKQAPADHIIEAGFHFIFNDKAYVVSPEEPLSVRATIKNSEAKKHYLILHTVYSTETENRSVRIFVENYENHRVHIPSLDGTIILPLKESLNDDVRIRITTPDNGYFVIDFIDVTPEYLFSNVDEMLEGREIGVTYEAEYFLLRAHTLKGEDAISDASLFAVDIDNISFSLNNLISPSGSPAELLWGDVDNYIHNIKIYFRVRGEGEIELSPENKESISSDTFKWVELPIAIRREEEFLTPFRREIFMRNLLVDALSLKLLPENLNLGRLISLSPADLIHENTKGGLSNETLVVLPEKYNPLWKLKLVSKVGGKDLSNNFSVISIPVDYVLQGFMITKYPNSGVDLDQVEVRVYNSSEELPTNLAPTSFLLITISLFVFVITIILIKRTKNGSSGSRTVG